MIDFDHDAYEAVLNQLRDECIAGDVSAQDLLERHISEENGATIAAMRLCGELSIGVEQQRVEGLLVTGFFQQLETRERIAALLLCIEVSKRIEQHSLKTSFAPYSAEHPLFRRFPSLFGHVRDGELLDSAALGAIGTDGLVDLRTGYARLDPMLSPHIVHTLAHAFPGTPLYVRLNPTQAWTNRPQQILLETIMVPADPRWWRTLGLFRGEQTGGQYCVIPPGQAGDDVDAYLEYHVKGFRKLETIAQRKKPDHLTMMLEELQLLKDGLLIGRCIHLDTSAPSGTSPAKAEVMHVDLAINVYTDSKVAERLASQMNDAEKEKASFRTHLLRAEGVPFEVLTLLSYMFFGSHSLRRDLFVNQFLA